MMEMHEALALLKRARDLLLDHVQYDGEEPSAETQLANDIAAALQKAGVS